MRKTFFGELIFQPGDDFFAEWNMNFQEDPDGEIARFIEHDPETGWGCEITDNNDRTAHAADFESREALVEWLTQNKIEVEV
ncbi:hypothetical protein CcrColossus_gp273 [Caulobacter phage CcrColossus]|uniref:Uncharacterized protein n=1 Tax=Caulobacter phage CcrColossus TaxID=1211640 RepID=K4JW71_9CAUD|nr:hypothetical protein CcrColossus_gp273 [Caulobacter phage CcrColossus]AFU88143.1 hypothetical protein CcrColossus_gp273 [Caulobacter phage CcrColossus]